MGSALLIVGLRAEWTACFSGGSDRPPTTTAEAVGIPRQTQERGRNVEMSPSVDMSLLGEQAVNSASTKMPHVIAAVAVDFDKSVFLQMMLFSLLVIVLKPLLFDPMLRVFALREERTDGAKSEAREMQEKAAEILSNYESQVAKVRSEATSERDNLRKETAAREAEILEEARVAAEVIAKEGREKLAVEVAALSSDLDKHAAVLAKEIAGGVLGKGAGS